MSFLSKLKLLWAQGCTSLVKLPSGIEHIPELHTIYMETSTECKTSVDGNFGSAWKQLHELLLTSCGGFVSAIDFGALEYLNWLEVSCSTITKLPDSIGLLEEFTWLEISCERLQCLPKSLCNLQNLQELRLSGCESLTRLSKTLGALTHLNILKITNCGIKKLPRSLGQLSQLKVLIIAGCKNMQRLSASITQLNALKKFIMEDCGSIEAMGVLRTLQGLPLWGSTSITKLPPALGIVSTLVACKCEGGCPTCKRFYGNGQLLEEDESGCLTAYNDTRSGYTELLRWTQEDFLLY